MANDVFANGMEIACKSGDGKVIAAFPDFCLSPPTPPAGPVPIPYPVSSFARDTKNGSKKVLITGKEVMLKSKSYYKKCTGDEPATKSLGMGVITHCIQGKTYFAMWSPDVKIEKKNVDRHLDITNSNGQSTTNQYVWANADNQTLFEDMNCDEILEKAGVKLHRHGDSPCESPEQSDHIIQNACFQAVRTKSATNIPAAKGYNHKRAPCICLVNSHRNTEHGNKTAAQREWANDLAEKNQTPRYEEARDKNLDAVKNAKDPPMSKEAMECISLAVEDYFEDELGMKDNPPVRRPPKGGKPVGPKIPKAGKG